MIYDFIDAKDMMQDDPRPDPGLAIDMIDERDLELVVVLDPFWKQVEVVKARLESLPPEDLAAHIVATRRVGRKFQEEAGVIQWICMNFDNSEQGFTESFCGEYSIFRDYDMCEVYIPDVKTHCYKGSALAGIHAGYHYQARRLHRAYDDEDFRRCCDFIFDAREGSRPEDWPSDENQIIKWLHANPASSSIISEDSPGLASV